MLLIVQPRLHHHPINKFDLLNKASKKEMIYYLDEFYTTISKPGDVIAVFINDARK